MFPKHGSLLSETFLRWTRSRTCAFCGAQATECHHWPKRSKGYQDDSRVVPVCRSCHRRCEGEVVVIDGVRLDRIRPGEQVNRVNSNFRAFFDEALQSEIDAFLLDLKRWRGWL